MFRAAGQNGLALFKSLCEHNAIRHNQMLYLVVPDFMFWPSIRLCHRLLIEIKRPPELKLPRHTEFMIEAPKKIQIHD